MTKNKTEKFAVSIDVDLLRKFRKEVLNRYGRLYGEVRKATEEALKLWMKKGGKK